MYAVPEDYLSLPEYFLLEERSEVKHEYYQGAIYAMSGASMRHNLIVAHVIGSLDQQLSDKSCTVFPSDLRLKITATGLYSYPDISVICGEIHYADARQDTVINPTVIIEVLSPSTEGYDRGKKFQHYGTIATLREYLIIAQDNPRVEYYRRQKEHHWMLVEFTRIDQVVHLKSIGCTLALEAIYKKVVFDKSGGDNDQPDNHAKNEPANAG